MKKIIGCNFYLKSVQNVTTHLIRPMRYINVSNLEEYNYENQAEENLKSAAALETIN